MKVLLSSVVLFATLFYSFTVPTDNPIDECTVEAEMPVTTFIKICDFPSSIAPAAGCSSVAMEIVIPPDDPCIGIGLANVRAVNLSANPVQGVAYSLPTGMPDLYYEYTVDGGGGAVPLGPIDEFYYNGESINGEPLFEAIAKMDFSTFGDNCTSTGYSTVTFKAKLTKLDGTLYPVADYDGTNEVFACTVFEENCNACNSFCTNTDPMYNVAGCGDCSSMDKDCKGNRSEEAELSTTAATSFTVQPNPFSDLLTLNYSLEKDNTVTIEILDAKGAKVYAKVLRAAAGVHTEYIDTHDFANGIYFSRMMVEGKTLTEKIIKNR